MSDEAQRRAAAMTELQRLINGGEFRMSIPVEEERDSDTVIGAVVSDSKRLEAQRDALANTLRKLLNSAPILDEHDRVVHKEGYAALAALEEEQ